MLNLTPNGRIAVGSLALIAAGFALGAIDRLAVTNEQALALLAGAAALLIIASRRRRHEVEDDEREDDR